MAEKEKLQISASALVELKATLFSKQREVQNQGKKNSDGGATVSTKAVSEKTAAIWRRPQKRRVRVGSARSLQRERATQRSMEEEAELERSRRALEAKAALYDKLCGGGGRTKETESDSDEEEGRYMVDFTRKIIEERNAQKQNSGKSGQAESGEEMTTMIEGGAEEVGEWVEYIDPFGRTRRCPKEDLPHVSSHKKPDGEENTKRRERLLTPDLMSEDMAMERERRRWEAEEEEKMERASGPVHYQEMRQGEVRTHGVGYYAFSKDEEKRSEQLNLLNRLRDQTVSQREKKAKLLEKRDAKMAARLEKVRRMKQLKQPVPQEKEDEEENAGTVEKEGLIETTPDPIAAMIDSQLSEARERAEKGGETTKPNKPYVRPWDKGKVVDPIRKRKQELEDERLSEFAPPSSYYKTGGTTDVPKVAKVDGSLPRNGAKVEPLIDHSGTTTIVEETKAQNVSAPPPPPPPLFQPPLFGVHYPPPPNQMFVAPQFGPPPPPPGGPQPIWYPQYFNPQPPAFYNPPSSSS